MTINIDKGPKIKIKKINILGNEKLSYRMIEKSMKNTKRKKFYRVFKRSKYIPEDFQEDLSSVIEKYKERGYRDARIISDSIYDENKNEINIEISLTEGEKYSFGKIEYLGNTIYTDQQLNQILKILFILKNL